MIRFSSSMTENIIEDQYMTHYKDYWEFYMKHGFFVGIDRQSAEMKFLLEFTGMIRMYDIWEPTRNYGNIPLNIRTQLLK